MHFKRLLCRVCGALLLLTGCRNEEIEPPLKTKQVIPSCAAFSRDGQNLVAGFTDGSVMVWDVRTGGKVKTFKRHDDKIDMLTFSANGAVLASDGEDKIAHVSKWNSSQEPLAIKHQTLHANIAVSPDGKTFALVDDYRVIKLYETATGKQITEFNREGDLAANALTLDFSPDGKSLAVGFDNDKVMVWNLASPSQPRTLHTQGSPTVIATYSPNGKMLACGGGEGIVEIWDTATDRRKNVCPHSHAVLSVAFSPDSKWMATSPISTKLWDMTNNTSHNVIIGTFDGTQPFSPDGKLFADIQDHDVYLYNTHGWALAKKLTR